MNRLLTKKTPLGKVDTRSYDLNGNLKTFTDRRSITSQYAYDVLDRLLNETYADSMTDQTGALDSKFFYEPFGQTTTTSDYLFQFTGRVPVTDNLYHYRARFYNLTLGRFISEDAIGFAGLDVNLYRYVWNNPLSFMDPLGLAPQSCGPCDPAGRGGCGQSWIDCYTRCINTLAPGFTTFFVFFSGQR